MWGFFQFPLSRCDFCINYVVLDLVLKQSFIFSISSNLTKILNFSSNNYEIERRAGGEGMHCLLSSASSLIFLS